MNLTTSIVDITSAFVTPPASNDTPKASLSPKPGAPLASEVTLIPSKYLSEKKDEELGATPSPSSSASSGLDYNGDPAIFSQASSINLHPLRTGPNNLPHLNLVRSPPSQLLDAPARAALNMPNAATASGQARAVRGEPKTPEYEIDNADEEGGYGAGLVPPPYSRGRDDRVPLLAPTAVRPGLSRSSSAASTSSTRGMLRRIFIDRATTPSQHLTRPTFPPPSLSTYSPLPPTALTLSSKINLFINQAISVALSTVFLTFVVLWATSAELARALPKWVWPTKPAKFPWDDENYWRKEGKKVSKDPRDYALQVGMDIEHQTVETDDGYYLK